MTNSAISTSTSAVDRQEKTDHLPHGVYPIHLNISAQPILVVGAGAVAARKIAGIVAAGGAVTVVAPAVNDRVRRLESEAAANDHVLSVYQRPYQRGEAASYRLVFTATDEPSVNNQVFTDCEAAGVWCNSADDLDNCSFILPALTRRDPMMVTVSSNGVSPALSSWLNRRIGEILPENLEVLVGIVATVRAEVRTRYSSTEAVDWASALDNNVEKLLALAEAGSEAEAEALLLDSLKPFGTTNPIDQVAINANAKAIA